MYDLGSPPYPSSQPPVPMAFGPRACHRTYVNACSCWLAVVSLLRHGEERAYLYHEGEAVRASAVPLYLEAEAREEASSNRLRVWSPQQKRDE
jgi:hypothetical protein